MPSPFDLQVSEAVFLFDFIQRIPSVTLTPEPEAIRLRFNTTVATSPIIEIFDLLVRADAPQTLQFDGAKLVRVAFDFLGVAKRTRHAVRIDGLEQERQYMFRITAGGGLGAPAVITGRFSTGRRDVELFVRDIGIWADGDPGLFNGEGEMEFGFALYGRDIRLAHRQFPCEASAGDLIQWPFGRGERGRDSGLRADRAPDSLTVYVLGAENDNVYPPFHPWATAPLQLPPSTTASKSPDFTKVDALQSFALPLQTGEYRLEVDLRPPRAWDFHYFATGWIDVRVANPPRSRVIGPQRPLRLREAQVALVKGIAAALGGGQAPGSGSAVWLDADGVLSVGLRQEGSSSTVDWQRVSREPVEAAAAASAGDTLCLVARCGSELRRSVVRSDGTVVSPWAPALAARGEPGESRRLQGPLTIAHTSHATAVAARSDDAIVICILKGEGFEPAAHFCVPDQACTQFALAWTNDETLALVGLRPPGTVFATEWQFASGAAIAPWKQLESPPLDALTIVPPTDGGPAALVGVTTDRKLVVRAAGLSAEAGWECAGSLDQLSVHGEQASLEIAE